MARSSSSDSPEPRIEAILRLARRLKRERDEARNRLDAAHLQLEAFEALLAGAFPPATENP